MMDTHKQHESGTNRQQWPDEASGWPASGSRAPADDSAPDDLNPETLLGPLSGGAADVLHAVEDCIEEIRFHQSALVRALQRRSSMGQCLDRLISAVSHQTSARQAGVDAACGSVGTMAGSAGSATQALEHADHPVINHEIRQLNQAAVRPGMTVFCLGQTRILQDERPVGDWPNGKGKAVFKYLLLHRRQPVAKERLIQLFWPETDPEGARNNLNVTVYGIRKLLSRVQPEVSHIVLRDGCYRLNSALDWWIDAEVFEECAQRGREHEVRGRVEEAMAAYSEAEQLYHGDLFSEDRADEWCQADRQRLRECALDLLRRLAHLRLGRDDMDAAVAANRRLLDIDPCDEETHRELMRLYARQDHPHLAVRQFRACAEALSRELNMIPSPETTALNRRIQQREVP